MKRAAARVSAAVVVSVAAHAGFLVLTPMFFRPEPVERQEPQSARMDIAAYPVEQTTLDAQTPDSTQAAESAQTGPVSSATEIRRSEGAPVEAASTRVAAQTAAGVAAVAQTVAGVVAADVARNAAATALQPATNTEKQARLVDTPEADRLSSVEFSGAALSATPPRPVSVDATTMEGPRRVAATANLASDTVQPVSPSVTQLGAENANPAAAEAVDNAAISQPVSSSLDVVTGRIDVIEPMRTAEVVRESRDLGAGTLAQAVIAPGETVAAVLPAALVLPELQDGQAMTRVAQASVVQAAALSVSSDRVTAAARQSVQDPVFVKQERQIAETAQAVAAQGTPAQAADASETPASAMDASARSERAASFEVAGVATSVIVPEARRAKAALAWSGATEDIVDPVSLAAIQSFMQPSDLATMRDQRDDLRDGIADILARVPCARAQTRFDVDTGTLELRGHVPEDGLRSPVLAALQEQVGGSIPIVDRMLILPRPQCNVLPAVAAIGLPQSTEQETNPKVIGPEAFVRDYVYTAGQRLELDAQSPDYDAVIYVDYFDADGNVIHLQPNEIVPLEQYPAKSRMTIGRPLDNRPSLEITIAPPFGQEIAVALATSTPLYDGLRPFIEPAEPYLQFLKERVAQLREQEPGFKGEWVYFFVTTRAE